MIDAVWIGSAGVALLLLAFLLNLLGLQGGSSRPYHAINAVGAALATVASFQIDFMPFALLEGTWCLVALAALAGMLPTERKAQ